MKRILLVSTLSALTLVGLCVDAAFAQQRPVRRNLPPVLMDSFIREAGSQAELIYGDEGANGLPPIDNFKKENRIDAGIHGITDLGLTTGHGSIMPDAWGADEFISPPGEWTQSGAKGNIANPFSLAATNLDSRTSNRGGSGGSGSDVPPPDGPPPPGEEWNSAPVSLHGTYDGYMTKREAEDFNSGDRPRQAAAWESYANRQHGGLTENDQYIIHQEILGY